MALSPEETRRYARHLVLKGVGGGGQNALKDARIAIVGAGGLGAPVIAYLAAAGVGQLSIFDPDPVDVSNLQRQIIHQSASAGENKAQSAARFIATLNPHVDCIVHPIALDPENAAQHLSNHDLVIEGTDSFDARAAIAKACESREVTLISGAVTMFDGQVTVLAPHTADEKGRPNPRFTDLFAVAPEAGEVPACEDVGVLGTLTGTIGTMMANEAIKLVTGFGPPLIGKLLIYSARSGETRVMAYARR